MQIDKDWAMGNGKSPSTELDENEAMGPGKSTPTELEAIEPLRTENKLEGLEPPTSAVESYTEAGNKWTELDVDEAIGRVPRATSLWPYKLVFFSLYGAKGVMDCFLPLYFKELGLNPAQIGAVMFCKPIGGFLSGITISQLSKKFRNQQRLICVIIIFYIGSGLSACFLQPLPLAKTCPDLVINTTRWNITLSKPNIEVNERSWMYDTSNMSFFISCLFFLSFWIDFFLVATDSLMHSITVRWLGKSNVRSYGVVRAWAAMGYGGLSLTTGLVVTPSLRQFKVCRHLLKVEDYHYMFYVFLFVALLLLMGVQTIHQSEIHENHEDQDVAASIGEFKQAICTVKNISWVVLLLCRSIFYAVTQGFLNWHLENIGASPSLIGLCNFVTTSTEFVVFHFMPTLTRRFGEFKLATIGITSYVLRFFVFSVITNPIYILPVEIMEGTMFAFLWSSGVTYLSGQVNDKGQNQLQGLIQAIVMLGTGLGLILSGELTQFFGAPTTFTIFSVLAAVSSFSFILVQILTNKKQ